MEVEDWPARFWIWQVIVWDFLMLLRVSVERLACGRGVSSVSQVKLMLSVLVWQLSWMFSLGSTIKVLVLFYRDGPQKSENL